MFGIDESKGSAHEFWPMEKYLTLGTNQRIEKAVQYDPA